MTNILRNKFYIGDRVRVGKHVGRVHALDVDLQKDRLVYSVVNKNGYLVKAREDSIQYDYPEPKFKVGDNVKHIFSDGYFFSITYVSDPYRNTDYSWSYSYGGDKSNFLFREEVLELAPVDVIEFGECG